MQRVIIVIMEKKSRKTNFIEGLHDGFPICLGYFAVSFAIGIQAAGIGMTSFQAAMLSLLNVTSAGQFAGIEVIAAGGSLLEMAGVQFIINLRYMLMSTALSQKVDPSLETRHRLGIAYGVTDEIFGISILREGILSPWFSYGAIFIAVAGWVAGTFFGALAGSVLPQRLIYALGIALYGMFIAIIVPPAREEKSILIGVLSAMAASTILSYAPAVRNLSSGTRVILVTLVISAVCAWIWPVQEEGSEKK